MTRRRPQRPAARDQDREDYILHGKCGIDANSLLLCKSLAILIRGKRRANASLAVSAHLRPHLPTEDRSFLDSSTPRPPFPQSGVGRCSRAPKDGLLSSASSLATNVFLSFSTPSRYCPEFPVCINIKVNPPTVIDTLLHQFWAA